MDGYVYKRSPSCGSATVAELQTTEETDQQKYEKVEQEFEFMEADLKTLYFALDRMGHVDEKGCNKSFTAQRLLEHGYCADFGEKDDDDYIYHQHNGGKPRDEYFSLLAAARRLKNKIDVKNQERLLLSRMLTDNLVGDIIKKHKLL